MRGERYLGQTVISGLLIVLVSVSTSIAQPSLNLSRATAFWPDVYVEFLATCNGSPVYNLGRQDFELREDGRLIQDFTIQCPDPNLKCAISSVLLFDASFSMSGGDNAAAKAGGQAFVAEMDGALDEATVMWFGGVVTTYQQMTTIKPMLTSAISVLPASGSRNLWDGAYAALVELINNGINQCRSVILITNGEDQSSTREMTEALALARRHRVQIYTILIGFSSVGDELRILADSTGGRFYQTANPALVPAMYTEIYSVVQARLFDCVLSYETACPDGSERLVELRALTLCGAGARDSTRFHTAVDSTQYATIEFELTSAMGMRDSDVRMPVRLITPLQNVELHPLSFRILFDTTRITLLGAEAATGSLYEGTGFSITRMPGGAMIETNERRVVSGPGLMFALLFHTNAADTGCADVRGSASSFAGGCMIPRLNNATVCVYPSLPVVTCTGSAINQVVWDKASGAYMPESFPVMARFSNNGATPAELRFVRIDYGRSDIALLAPLRDTVFFSNAEILAGQATDVAWDVKPLPDATTRRARLCLTASFVNHDDVTCCVSVVIAKADASLSCTLSVPELLADTASQLYVPMPFPVMMSIENVGGSESGNATATIELSADLELAFPDAPSTFSKSTTPARIAAGGSGQVMWNVQHPISRDEKAYTLTVRTSTTDGDTLICTAEVLIPAMPVVFQTVLTSTGPLEFCDGGSVELDAGDGYVMYRWNTGHTERLLTATGAGAYWCVLRAADGTIGLTDTLVVTVHALPEIPTITRVGDVLTSTAAYAYQWSLDGQDLPGEVSQTHTVRSVGRYRVRVTSPEGCSSLSEPLEVVTLSVPLPVYVQSFDVWPEPNDGRMRVMLRTAEPRRTTMIVRTILGQELLRYESVGAMKEYIEDVDLGAAPAGVYFLHVTSGGATWVRAVVRARR